MKQLPVTRVQGRRGLRTDPWRLGGGHGGVLRAHGRNHVSIFGWDARAAVIVPVAVAVVHFGVEEERSDVGRSLRWGVAVGAKGEQAG